MFIIASFLLSFHACGYKAAPMYEEEAPKSDANVEFILQKKIENNESCQ